MFALAADRHPEQALLNPGHGIQGVVQQVEQHLFEANRITQHHGVAVDCAVQLHLFAAQAGRQQLQRLFQHVAQAQALAEAGRALAGEGLQVPGEPGHALQQAIDAAQAFVHVGLATAVEQQAQAAQLHLHGGQRLVDFMGHGRRHLPQGGHLRRMHQAVLGLAQLGGAQRHLAFQALANACLQTLVLAPLSEKQQQKRQGHPHPGGRQAVAAHAVEQRLRLDQQVQGPVFLGQRQALPEVVAAPVRAIDPAPFAVLADAPAQLAGQRLQRLLGVLAHLHQLAAGLFAQRLQGEKAPGRAAAEDHHRVAVGHQQHPGLAGPLALQLLQFELGHQHAEHAAVSVAHHVGEEIAGNPGGHAHREIAPGRLAHGILKVGAEGVVVADEAAPVAPVARHQRLAPAVEQVEHGGAGGGIQLLETLIEFFAQQAIPGCRAGRARWSRRRRSAVPGAD
ncbi:hypothetical protein D3C85_687990 [compost metagenome]